MPFAGIHCPYCGEPLEVFVEPPADDQPQHYVEDCQVCCRPIELLVTLGEDGAASVRARADHEG